MGVARRETHAAVLLILVFLSSGVPAAGPTACVDGCDDGDGAVCANCPLCSPAGAALLPTPHDGRFPQLAVAFEPLPTPHCCRTEDRGVFHVPRHLL